MFNRKRFLVLFGALVIFLACTCNTQAIVGFAGHGYWDLFCVNLTPNNLFWKQVNGGVGALGDPLIQPDQPGPIGIPIIDPATPLGGVAYGFGGWDWGNHTLESTNVAGNSIQLNGAASYYLSVVLDTRTKVQRDTLYPSWGTIADIQVQPVSPGGILGPAIPINNWVLSPYDPNPVAAVLSQNLPLTSATVSLAPTDFGKAEGANQTAAPDGKPAIFGVGVKLPSLGTGYIGYNVTFTTSLNTWDSYNKIPPQSGTWIASGGSNWSNPSNWMGGTYANGTGATATFTMSASTTINVDDIIVYSPYGAPSKTYDLQIGTLNFSGPTSGIYYTVNDVTTAQTGITLTSTTSGSMPTIQTAANTTINAALSGTQGLMKQGMGTLVLTASNTYIGQTAIMAGTLELTSTGQLPPESDIFTDSGAMFQIDGGSKTVDTITGTGETSVMGGDLTATSIVQDTLTIGAVFSSAGDNLLTVPEPSVLSLIGFGVISLITYAWRRRKY
jgi:autotransporter-associated beta strand protein